MPLPSNTVLHQSGCLVACLGPMRRGKGSLLTFFMGPQDARVEDIQTFDDVRVRSFRRRDRIILLDPPGCGIVEVQLDRSYCIQVCLTYMKRVGVLVKATEALPLVVIQLLLALIDHGKTFCLVSG
eukprot:g53439.t1